jgi:prephenate dehydratase
MVNDSELNTGELGAQRSKLKAQSSEPTAAFQGETGAFSEAAIEALVPGATAVPRPTFEQVFESVAKGDVDLGVVPIENSLFGSVHINYDLLKEHHLRIIGEVSLRIHHCLMALPGTELGEIRQVHSHPQALGQCRPWLREHLPAAESIPAYDTAGAARMVSAMGVGDTAAIAGARAAEEYGLEILAENIEANPNNYTRFLALSNVPLAVGSEDSTFKTTILYSLRKNEPGGLYQTLGVFALRKINLHKIESRPLIGEPGRYVFYVDVEGHAEHEPLSLALDHLRAITESTKVLGSYRTGRMVD